VTFVIRFRNAPWPMQSFRGLPSNGALGFISEPGRIPVCLCPGGHVVDGGPGAGPADYGRLAATGPCQGGRSSTGRGAYPSSISA